jgi:hypothetical protein
VSLLTAPPNSSRDFVTGSECHCWPSVLPLALHL